MTEGIAEGRAIVVDGYLGAWGVMDPVDGIFIDEHDPKLYGHSFAGKVLVFRGAVGSSGWSLALHQARINGVAPAAMIYQLTTTKVALGAVVARIPSITDCDRDIFTFIADGDFVHVDANDGVITVSKNED